MKHNLKGVVITAVISTLVTYFFLWLGMPPLLIILIAFLVCLGLYAIPGNHEE